MVSLAVRDVVGQARTTGEPQNTKGLKLGARVRITAGQAVGVEDVIVAEYVPLKPRAWKTWTIKTDDLVGRREIREPVP